MNKALLLLAAVAFSLTLSPLHAQSARDAGPKAAKVTKKAKPKKKKKARSKKKAAAQEQPAPKKAEPAAPKAEEDFVATPEKRAALPFKWHKSLEEALAEAKKYNTTCFVVYTNHKGCPACVQFDKAILDRPEFVNAKGVGVGYRSPVPLPQFGLDTTRPMTVIVDGDGKQLDGKMGYIRAFDTSVYLDRLREAQPRMFPAAGK